MAHANRQAQKRRESRGMVDVLTQSWQAEHARLNGLCGSLDTDAGEPCQNPRGDSDHCHLHTDG